MRSLRLPKRLTMHADDERDHMFLVRRLSRVNGVYYFDVCIIAHGVSRINCSATPTTTVLLRIFVASPSMVESISR